VPIADLTNRGRNCAAADSPTWARAPRICLQLRAGANSLRGCQMINTGMLSTRELGRELGGELHGRNPPPLSHGLSWEHEHSNSWRRKCYQTLKALCRSQAEVRNRARCGPNQLVIVTGQIPELRPSRLGERPDEENNYGQLMVAGHAS